MYSVTFSFTIEGNQTVQNYSVRKFVVLVWNQKLNWEDYMVCIMDTAMYDSDMCTIILEIAINWEMFVP